jgi:cytidyltransferase-like protein
MNTFTAKAPYALVLGRFQPIHLQHLEYLQAAARLGRHLIVGVTNPSPQNPIPSPTAPHRELQESNPFSYFDRQRMLRACLLAADMRDDDFTIVPAALGSPSLLETLPSVDEILCCITINDAWGKEKQRLLEEAGLQVKVLWERTNPMTLITGTMIRERIRAQGEWQEFVPPAATSIIREIWADRRSDPS